MPNNECVLPKRCPPDTLPDDATPVLEPTPSFEFCAGNKQIAWDGYQLTYTSAADVIQDGTYDKVSFRDGCIISVEDGEIPVYTPAYCNPQPQPCGGSGGDSTGAPISTRAGNLLVDDGLGRYAALNIQSGEGVTVVGTGTATDPLKISISGGSGGSGGLIALNRSIEVTEENGINKVGLPKQLEKNTTVGNLTINEFGVVTAVSDVDDTDSPIQAGDGITIEDLAGGVKRISQKKSGVTMGDYDLSEYTATLDAGGNIVALATKSSDAGKKKPILDAYYVHIGNPGQRTSEATFKNAVSLGISGEAPQDIEFVAGDTTMQLSFAVPEYARSGNGYVVEYGVDGVYAGSAINVSSDTVNIVAEFGEQVEYPQTFSITIREK